MEIRVTQPHDADALHEIMTASLSADQLDPNSIIEPVPTPDEIRAEIATTPMENYAVILRDERVSGYVRVNWWEEADGTFVFNHRGRVHPAERRQGLGRALLDWAQNRCLSLAHRHCDTGRGVYATRIARSEIGAQALFRAEDYINAFTVLEMRHQPPSSDAVPPLPAGMQRLPVIDEHHLPIWKAMLAAYPAHVPGLPVRTADDFDAFLLDAERDQAMWQTIWNGTPGAGGEVAGTLWARLRADGIGQIYEIAVPPHYRGQRIAAALIGQALTDLYAAGASEVRACIPAPMQRLYARCGFEVAQSFDHLRKVIDFANV